MALLSGPPPDGKERYRRRFVLVMTIVLVLLFLAMVKHLLVGMIAAMLLWWATHGLYRRLLVLFKGRRGAAAGIATGASFILILVPIMVVLTLLVVDAGSLVSEGQSWYDPLRPQIEERLQQLTRGRTAVIFGVEIGGPSVARVMERLSTQLGEFAMRFVTGMVSGVAQAIFLLLVTLYSLYFFYLDGLGFLDWLQRLLPLTREQSNIVFRDFFLTSKATLTSLLVIGAVQGGLGGLGMWFVGAPAPIFWTLIMGVLSAIPALGPFVVLIPTSLILVLSGKLWLGIALAGWTLLIVGTIDNILRPYLVARSARLHELLVFLGIIGGIAMFGFFGLLLGPVIVAMLRAILRMYIEVYGSPPPEPAPVPEK